MAQVEESFFLYLINGFAAILTVKQMLFHHLFQSSCRIKYPTVPTMDTIITSTTANAIAVVVVIVGTVESSDLGVLLDIQVLCRQYSAHKGCSYKKIMPQTLDRC